MITATKPCIYIAWHDYGDTHITVWSEGATRREAFDRFRAEHGIPEEASMKTSRKVEVTAQTFATIDGDDIIDHMQVQADDECGEAAEDWLTGLDREVRCELTAAIGEAIASWVKRHDLEPRFFSIAAIEEVPAAWFLPVIEGGAQ